MKYKEFNIHDTLTPLLLHAIQNEQRKLAILLVRSPKVKSILNKSFGQKSILAWAIEVCASEPIYWGANVTTFEKDPLDVSLTNIVFNYIQEVCL